MERPSATGEDFATTHPPRSVLRAGALTLFLLTLVRALILRRFVGQSRRAHIGAFAVFWLAATLITCIPTQII